MPLSEYEMREFFAGNLKFLRKRRGHRLSQAALARLLNLSKYAINNYELGRATPSAYTANIIADYFHCSMESLLTTKLYERKDE